MSNITIEEAQAWCMKPKLDLGRALDGALETQLSTQVLSRVAMTYDVSSWSTAVATPKLIRTILAMKYAAFEYYKRFSDDNDDANAYAAKLDGMADNMLANILDGVTVIPGVIPTSSGSSPSFYPTDASTAATPTASDSSLGPAAFSMGTVF